MSREISKRKEALLFAALCSLVFQGYGVDAVWNNPSTGLEQWTTLANWTDSNGGALSGIPTNAADNVTFPHTTNWTKQVQLPGDAAFSLAGIYGDFFYVLRTPPEPRNTHDIRTLNFDDASGFAGRWMPNSVKMNFAFTGDVAEPCLSALDTSKRPCVITPENTDASIGMLSGGLGLLCKRGEGNLKLEYTMPSGGLQASVEAGSLELSGRSESDLGKPAGTPLFWVASDDLSSFTIEEADSRAYVAEWRDVRHKDGVNTISAVPVNNNASPSRPWLSANKLAGKAVVDFGAYYKRAYYGDVETLGPAAGLKYSLPAKILEAFIVWEDTVPDSDAFYIGQQQDYHFHRGSDNYLSCVFCGNAQKFVREGILYLDGSEVNYQAKPDFGKFHIFNFTILNDGAKPDTFAIDRNVRYGGVRIAEAIFYTNRLSYAEKAATTRYLAAKWKDPSLAVSDKDLHVLRMAGETASVAVSEGRVAKVDRVVASHGVVNKTGDGVLEVGRFQPEDVTLNIAGGAVALSKDRESSIPWSQPAEGAIFWGDASKDGFFVTTNSAEGVEYITRWNDCRSKTDTAAVYYAEANSFNGYAPVAEENGCNGLRVIDFGDYAKGGGSGAYFQINCGDKIRETFKVLLIKNDDNYTPNIIGSSDQAYLRENKNSLLHPVHAYNTPLAGIWTMNGEIVDPLEKYPIAPNEWYVVGCSVESLHKANIIGGDRPSSTKEVGDIKVGEILCYSRRLTEDERHRTVAYLMKKWKNAEYVFSRNASGVKKIDFTAENDDPVLLADADTVVSNVVFSGAKTLRKEGEGDITVAGTLDSRLSELTVSSGSLEVLSANALFSDAYFHVDASKPETIAFREGQEDDRRIEKWYDCRNNGSYAATPMVEPNNDYGGLTNAVYRVAGDDSDGILSGMGYVDFLEYVGGNASTNKASGMWWYNADGTRKKSSNVREFHLVFMMVKDPSISRDINSAPIAGDQYTNTDGLVPKGGVAGGFWSSCTNAATAAKKTDGSDWFNDNQFIIDGRAVTNYFHVMSLVSTGAISACSFAIDRRNCGRGSVKLCEAIVFEGGTNTLEKSAAIHSYLLKKWKGLGENKLAAFSLDKLSVASGATLAFPAGELPVKAKKVTGGGTINIGDVFGVEEIEASIDGEGNVSVVEFDGKVTFADAVSVKIDVAGEDNVAEGLYPILKAKSLGNANTANWTKILPDDTVNSYAIVSDDTAISLRISKPGTLLIVR